MDNWASAHGTLGVFIRLIYFLIGPAGWSVIGEVTLSLVLEYHLVCILSLAEFGSFNVQGDIVDNLFELMGPVLIFSFFVCHGCSVLSDVLRLKEHGALAVVSLRRPNRIL